MSPPSPEQAVRPAICGQRPVAPADPIAPARRQVRPSFRLPADGGLAPTQAERCAAAPMRPALAGFGHGAIRVLQNARAPAQLSLLLRR